MSLIHQALKKLDGTRGGYSTETLQHGPARPLGRSTAARLLIAAVLVTAAIAVAVFSSYAYRTYYINKGTAANAGPNVPAAGPAPAGDAVQSTAELNRQGMYLYHIGSYTESAREFNSALATAPDDPVLHNNLALAYMREGSRTKAETHFKKALELKPDYPEALNNHAMLLATEGRNIKALKLLERAVNLAPGYSDAVLNTAALLEGMERRTEAVRYYERYLAIGDKTAEAVAIRKKIALLRAAIILGKD